MKILINSCYGGYWLSDETVYLIGRRLGITDENILYDYQHGYKGRTESEVIAIIEKLRMEGKDYSESCSNVHVVEIPDNTTDWKIDEYDGSESIIYVVDGKLHEAW